jgi:putative protease
LAVNAIPRAGDLEMIDRLIAEVSGQEADYRAGCAACGTNAPRSDALPDAFIVSDPAVMEIIHRRLPGARLHLSTQANVVNAAAARFWHAQGISRIVLARELSLGEIFAIREDTPPELELEAFVHGAMCISYSGRCLLSTYMTGRDGNRGECAQPCRWEYFLQEKLRSGEVLTIEEDRSGTYILNSKDLCLIRHLSALAEAGVSSFKIEGRMKSVYYVAAVTNAYRAALGGIFPDDCAAELEKVSHRPYPAGCLFGDPGGEGQFPQSGGYIRGWSFLGIVRDYSADSGIAVIEQRGRFFVGEEVEVFGPGMEAFSQKIRFIENEDGVRAESAPHPMRRVRIPMERAARPGCMLRRKD